MDVLDRIKLKVFRNASARAIMLPFLARPRCRWAFIVGSYNSGTTLLQRLVAMHPAVSGLPLEGVSLTRELARPEDFGCTRMWHKCREQIELGRDDMGPDPEKVLREWGVWVSGRSELGLEKSIANSARMPWLNRWFDAPHFLSIVRNGYCAAEGIRRRSLIGRYPMRHTLADCARQWATGVDVVDRDGTRVSRFHEVRYERLAEDPAGVLCEVFEYLGLPDPGVEATEDGVRIAGMFTGVRNMNAKSLGSLSDKDFDEIESEAGETLERKGYGRD